MPDTRNIRASHSPWELTGVLLLSASVQRSPKNVPPTVAWKDWLRSSFRPEPASKMSLSGATAPPS